MTFTQRAAQLVHGAPWTAEQALDAMFAIAVDSGGKWAEAAFLAIDFGRAIALPGEDCDVREWASALAGHTALNLIDDRERIAAGLDASPEQRRAFIGESVALFQARLEELMAFAAPGGHA